MREKTPPTPGDWEVHEGDDYVEVYALAAEVGQADNIVARVCGDTREESLANAALIKSSKKLQACVNELLTYAQWRTNSDDPRYPWIERALTALAESKGVEL